MFDDYPNAIAPAAIIKLKGVKRLPIFNHLNFIMKLSYFPSFCLYVALIIFLPACKKENVKTIKPVEIAPVKTNPATIYTDGGVTLNGTINKIPANLVEYGFFLSTDSTFRSVQPIKVSTPAAVGAFKADINTGLLKNTIYYCKAYNTVSDGSGLVTYNVVAFNSSGSKKIVTTSVAPLKADLDDTITIKGKYFTNQPGLAVKFGNQYSTIRLLSDSVIKCTVPINLDQQAPLIIVQDSFSADTATTKFSLNTPVIS
ncbi:MAG: IPT/TIG domain-containing protein, partial [Mucilaginibacter sp.]